MSKVIKLTAATFEDTIKNGVTMVDFWAPWCGPCRMIGPVVEEIAEDYRQTADICKVNTDEEASIAQKYGIRSIPTIMFFKNGELVDQMVGAASKKSFVEKLDEYL